MKKEMREIRLAPSLELLKALHLGKEGSFVRVVSCEHLFARLVSRSASDDPPMKVVDVPGLMPQWLQNLSEDPAC